ncbi:hypothetical protein [Enterobacter sp. CP102]|uniref:hypothetical protein n=1 Tax=Enterobacter sp. CP102 TaxID=2976431 RepID=UPI002203DC91|nr:hypothetical protein [Enterobacter sp. CP102]UWM62690.1 hypothetical protein N1249_14010 [Enterobacter sp. CP102]
MIKLNILSSEFENKYYTVMKDKYDTVKKSKKFIKLLPLCHKNTDNIIYFLDHNIKNILIGKPDILINFIHQYREKFPTTRKYLENKNRKKRKQTKIDNTVKLINMLFDYKDFSDKKKARKTSCKINAYSLIGKHNYRICPYCHLNHINYHFTHKSTNGFMMRPPLDHFFPESLYPWLATSLYNLIPCCEQCNSRIKLAEDPVLHELTNPFDNKDIKINVEWEYDYPLSYIKQPDDFSFTLKGEDSHSTKHEQFFKLNIRYHWYEAEVMDLLDSFEKYNSLPNSLLEKSVSIKEYVYPFKPEKKAQRSLGLFTALMIEKLIEHNNKYPRR